MVSMATAPVKCGFVTSGARRRSQHPRDSDAQARAGLLRRRGQVRSASCLGQGIGPFSWETVLPALRPGDSVSGALARRSSWTDGAYRSRLDLVAPLRAPRPSSSGSTSRVSAVARRVSRSKLSSPSADFARKNPGSRRAGRCSRNRSGRRCFRASNRRAGRPGRRSRNAITSGSICRSIVKFFPDREPSNLRLLHALNLDLADGLGDPFGGFGLRGLHEDFGRGLGQHDLGQMAVNVLKLGLALEAEHQRILAILRFSVMAVWSCGKLLQAGQLVDHKPDVALSRLRRGQQPHDQQVDPERDEAAGGFRARSTAR